MKRTVYIFYIFVVAVIVSCAGSGDTKELAAGNSGDADFEQTMSAADSLYNGMQFRDAYDLYLQLFDSKEAEADSEKKLRVLSSLCNASELSGHKDEENKWLQQQMDLAEATGNDYYHAMAHVSMGQNIFFEGDREKGIQYVNEAISLMAKTDRDDADHLTHGFLNLLASLYSEMKDYDSALQTNERNLQLTMEGTRWGGAQNQQLIDRRMALAKTAGLLARMGINSSDNQQSAYFQRADSAYAAWKAVQYEGNHSRDYFIVDYMKRRGLHREAVTIYNDLIERIRLQGDTLGEMMNTAKWGLADVYHQMGRCEQAATLYEQVLEIQDTLKSRKARNTAQELAAIYHDKEEQQTIMQQEAENTRQEAIILIVVIVLIAVMVLAAIVIVKNRIISRKNRLLAQQIAETVNYKKMYWEEKRTQKPAVAPDENIDTNEQLFQHINEVVIREKLFLDPKFGRQTIMDRFQLSKERVGAIFSQGSEHAKLNSYIQQLRLDYAANLLIEQPDRSVIEIATECGFSSNTYFSDCFRQHFGMSPTYFRKESLQQMSSLTLLTAILIAATFTACSSEDIPIPKPTDEIEEQLRQMTLSQKVGQMFFIRPEALDTTIHWNVYDDLMPLELQTVNNCMKAVNQKYPVGGIILYAWNIKDETQLAQFIPQLKALNGNPLMCIDEEGGRVARIANNNNFHVKKYESMAAIGATGDPANAYECGNTIGTYLNRYGFDIDFAPVADVNTNPENIVIGPRAFSDNPAVAAPMVTNYLQGLKDAGIVGCIKHFPGHGDTKADTHYGYAQTLKTWDEMLKCEIVTFRAGIQWGCQLIMTAHISAPNVAGEDIPSTMSSVILQDKLRGELGYQHIIVTDAMDMGAITQQYTIDEAVVGCIQAGADIVLCSKDFIQAFNTIVKAVEDGTITEERINQSVRRILKLKKHL